MGLTRGRKLDSRGSERRTQRSRHRPTPAPRPKTRRRPLRRTRGGTFRGAGVSSGVSLDPPDRLSGPVHPGCVTRTRPRLRLATPEPVQTRLHTALDPGDCRPALVPPTTPHCLSSPTHLRPSGRPPTGRSVPVPAIASGPTTGGHDLHQSTGPRRCQSTGPRRCVTARLSPPTSDPTPLSSGTPHPVSDVETTPDLQSHLTTSLLW